MIKPLSEIVAEAKVGESCLTVDESLKLIDECEKPLLVDVREPAEYGQGAVDGFINIPRGVLEMKMPELCSDADQCILLHCGTGGRAALAAKSLRAMGYSNVHLISASFDDIKHHFNDRKGA